MITVTNLYKSFPMGEHTLPVLKGIDLTIARANSSPSSARPELEKAPCCIF
jgi:hypothetical protein